MKKKIIKTVVYAVIAMFIAAAPQKSIAQISVNFQVFYDDLSPYGNWVDNPEYGYVWVPNVSSGFSPYSTNGHWIFTEDGWTWVSNYSWGWAPFHYGRWYHDPNYNWVWVPDNEWGPGWVTWRRSDDYYGWAPIGPGVSIDIAYSNGYDLPYDRWTFVRNRNFGNTNISNYYINNSNNVTIINNTTVINNARVDMRDNVRYNAGPDRAEVEKRVGRTFTPIAVRERNKPGQQLNKSELQIYRPVVKKDNAGGIKPAPAKLAKKEDLKVASPRNNGRPDRNSDQPTKQSQVPQPVRQKPNQPQQKDQPVKQVPQPVRQNNQPFRKETTQPQQKPQPVRQQPIQPKERVQPVKQVPQPVRQNDQPFRKERGQPQQRPQPVRQQPVPAQQKAQPARPQQAPQQQRPQPEQRNQPVRQQPSQPQQKQQPEQKQTGKPDRNKD